MDGTRARLFALGGAVAGWALLAVLFWQPFAPGATVSSTASAQTEAATFTPEVSVLVPQTDADADGRNDFADTKFVLIFRRGYGADAGCTQMARATYVVQGSGKVAVSGAAPALATRPGGAAGAASGSAGATAECVYDIAWPTIVRFWPQFDIVLRRQPGATASVRASDRDASAAYMSRFKPEVDISVPQLDADADGDNDFSGVRFVVEFEPMAAAVAAASSASAAGSGLGAGSDDGCSEAARGTYEVRDDGGVVAYGSEPWFVGRLGGATSGCVYRVGWPDEVEVAGQTAGAGLELQAGATASVVASARQATAVYVTGSRYVAVGEVVPEPEVEPDAEPEVAPVTDTPPELDTPPDTDPEVESPAPEVVDAEPEPGVTATTPEVADPEVDEPAPATPQPGAAMPETATPEATTPDVAEPESQLVAPEVAESEVGVVQLPWGWSVLPFNGPSGMSPADFAQALEGAINSVWVWDVATQQWKGWMASRGPIGLASLSSGDVVMVYAPVGGVVVYSPADLLGHRVGVNSWTLAPTGISLVVYGGGSATSASDVFASYANSAVVVYLWDSQNQRWEYHLPGRQPLDAVQVPWFSDINPGDAMFVYNISPTAVTIPWG